MSEHRAMIRWSRKPHPIETSTYSRNHLVTLNRDQTVRVSASTEYKGDAACADPEQLLVSAVASCHMLTFLAIAEFQGYLVESYCDDPVGYLETTGKGTRAVTRIVLSPHVSFGGERQPDASALARMHAGAHKNCFIRNSVTAEVTLALASVAA